MVVKFAIASITLDVERHAAWKNQLRGELSRTGVSEPHGQTSRRERSAAAARLRGLGIHEDESLLHQRFLVIEDHAVQIDERLRIDKNAHIPVLKDAVAFARLRVEADV